MTRHLINVTFENIVIKTTTVHLKKMFLRYKSIQYYKDDIT